MRNKAGDSCKRWAEQYVAKLFAIDRMHGHFPFHDHLDSRLQHLRTRVWLKVGAISYLRAVLNPANPFKRHSPIFQP
jgi:hypothetical protein